MPDGVLAGVTGGEKTIDGGGKSHHTFAMATASAKHPKLQVTGEVIRDYDVAADTKSRISLRGAKTKYFHVKVLSNGCFLLEPRVLVSPDVLPKRTLKMLEKSVSSLKKGKASAVIDLSPFTKD